MRYEVSEHGYADGDEPEVQPPPPEPPKIVRIREGRISPDCTGMWFTVGFIVFMALYILACAALVWWLNH